MERDRDVVSKGVKNVKGPSSKDSSGSSLPLLLDVEDFKGTFSFDDFYKNLVCEVLPPLHEEDVSSPNSNEQPPISNGNYRRSDSDAGGRLTLLTGPPFVEAELLQPLFKDARKELVDLCNQVDTRLEKLKKEVAAYDVKHGKRISELEKGVAILNESFGRLDSRISGVGQTAARIGDHLQAADAHRDVASQTIELIKYLMEFNSSPGDLMELSPLFTDDSRVAEAAAVAQKLRSYAEDDLGLPGPVSSSAMKNTPNASMGLEVAVANLQDYCNELENRLLAKFDAASQRRELSTMAECAKILSQFNRGVSAMQRYVASRPMFMDVEVMELDAKTVGEPSNIARGLNALYKEILDTVQKEAAMVTSVFPSPDAVMSILVQRILEQRVFAVLDRILEKPTLANPIPIEEGGYLQYLRTLATAVEKTQDLAKELQTLGCGDLDAEELAEALFSSHRDEYPELEQASLCQLYQDKIAELRVMGAQSGDPSSGAPGTPRGPGARAPATSFGGQMVMSVSVVTEFVRWNEEAVQRCTLLTPQPLRLATNVRAIFTCLLDQVSQYTTEGLERAQEALNEAAALRERFMLGTSVSRRVMAAAAAAAEAAAHAGESSVRSFMVAVQRATANVALVQQHFVNSISRLLLPVDGAHAACCEEMANAMANSEAAALKGLQTCIDTILAEADRLLTAEQKPPDYRPVDDGNPPDHRPTTACIRVVQYLARMLEAAQGALEGLNKQAFMTELGNRLHKSLVAHWLKYVFSASGGLRLKRDVSEYAEFVRSFKAPVVDEKFEQLGTLVNVFIVAPESLPTLLDSSLKLARKDALRFIQLREDYKSAKIATRFTTFVVD
ncbi:exocyst complex component 5 [Marchantia polymorpha subsp. ruderalis]|uniref:Exocyst complex component Sec10 n=2 Tax=Marchantia polymorpha TaxID=3197 RepID=A0AAF6B9P7_MARPO|nr:hypothetical protein MARPO_0070s0084 [Marchantia polymorpha]BBN08731.1 hypothetical protein Mp_4g13970 [Marchantia polymorpha subsp. ruderalis]|eukprot:PTQ35622.1 hypothetical protein MARPO_0070s0084 [Marchantia polymorpha]